MGPRPGRLEAPYCVQKKKMPAAFAIRTSEVLRSVKEGATFLENPDEFGERASA